MVNHHLFVSTMWFVTEPPLITEEPNKFIVKHRRCRWRHLKKPHKYLIETVLFFVTAGGLNPLF